MSRSCLLLLAAVTYVVAQVPGPLSPPPPAKYDIEIRYRIDAFRNERASQFKVFVQQLKALGFERDVNDDARGEDNLEIENTAMTRMKGTIPGPSARQVARLRPVLTVLLRPKDVDRPAPIKPIRVDLELSSGLGLSQQRAVAFELAEVLRELGFRQPAGYDNRRYTRLVGILPPEQLEPILNDIRRLPAAWPKLPPSLLADLRVSAGGAESLRATLDGWAAHPEGGKLVLAALEAWAVEPPAYRFIASLPGLVVNDSTLIREVKEAEFNRAAIGKETKARLVEVVRSNEVVREQVLLHFQRHEAAKPLLTKLLQDVFKDKSGPELMDNLLRRIEARDSAILLPPLFRGRSVIRIIEARPDLPPPEPSLLPPQVAEELHKIGPSLRELVKDAAQAGNLRRLEIILSSTPGPLDTDWSRPVYRTAPSLILEGRAGPIVSGRMLPMEAIALVRLPGVSMVRLPAEARSAVLNLPDEEGSPAEVLKATGLEPLLKRGMPLRPVRVAVIDSDFRGWQALVGKKLPARTRLVDLTTERNDALEPDPFAGPADQPGSGTLTAMSVALAAPWCELILLRVDASAPYHLQLIQRRLNGDEFFTDSLLARRFKLLQRRGEVNRRLQVLLRERVEIFKTFPDDKPANDPIARAKQVRLDAYRKEQAQFDTEEKAFLELEKTYLRYLTDLRELRDVRVVVCGLNWHDAYPVDGGSYMTRLLEDTPEPRFVWIQAAGNSRGQAWAGLFRDADGNGVMEFADDKTPLPKGNWNHELAFLAWQPFKGEATKALPKAKVRLTMQWREAHDPEYTKDGADPFRTPLSQLRLLVMRQLDPEGAKRPADDLIAIAENAGPALRIANEEGSAVYEHVVEFPVEAGARLALRVEGSAAKSTRPPGTAELPETVQFAELRPRIFLETLDGAGRVVFETYATEAGTFGTLADSRRALTVGALAKDGKPQLYSNEGTPSGLELLEKPDVRTFDRLGIDGAKNAGGNAMSAGLAGGYAASLLAHGTKLEDVARELKRRLKPR